MAINKLLIICGPTATGKTKLAINLVKSVFGGNSEVVSADSRQVYKHMDIGTGKEISNIKYQKSKIHIKNKIFIVYYLGKTPLWLWDIVEPNYKFSVADYKECADLVIGDILKRGKLPILVGGTGLYIKAVVNGIETLGISPDWELRQKLSNLGTEELREILEKTSPERMQRMNESDRNNKRRLVRAIEIAIKTKNLKVMSKGNKKLKFDPLFIGLTAPYKTLYQIVDKRVDERVNAGIEKEIKTLLSHNYNFKNSVLGTTIGYREWQSYFEGKFTLKEIIKRWKFNEHAYVRRQMIWFKKDKRIKWFNIDRNGWEKKVEELVNEWMKG